MAADVPKGLRVLRVCSVFEAPAWTLTPAAVRFDPIGGMQHHTGQLTRQLDRLGLVQTVLTSRLVGTAGAARGGRHVVVHRLGVRTRWLRQLWAVGALRRIMRYPTPVDIVHVHQGEDIAALAVGLLAARRFGCPLVVTVHCSLRHTFQSSGWRGWLLGTVGGAVERIVIDRADAIVTLTQAAADRLRASVVRVIPSGVDPSRFAGSLRDPFPTIGRPRILYVGRLAPQKNVSTLLDAFALMPDDRTQLVIVGDGPDRSALEAQARRSGQAGRIHFTGFLPHPCIPSVLAHADVLALPSRYEELGSVLLEAMQAGVPIVASSVGGIPELLEGGRSGRLVHPTDARAFGAALTELLTRPGAADALVAAARSRVLSYHWGPLAQQIAQVYLDTCRSQPRRGRTKRRVCNRRGRFVNRVRSGLRAEGREFSRLLLSCVTVQPEFNGTGGEQDRRRT
jgi:glycogen(starch) synthase